MRILVTGGAGFIGSNLIRAAVVNGHEIVVVDDLSTGSLSNLQGLPVEFFEGSVLDFDLLTNILDGVDSVVHLAALGSVPRSIKTPFATHAANATGTLTVLESMRAAGVDHIIAASSSSVYGRNPAMPKSEREWVGAMSPYAVTKLATEQYTLAYQDSFGIRSVAFRFFNVFGPWQRPGHAYSAVVPIFIDAVLNGRPIPINGDGQTSRDFTYVGTVCNAILEAVANRLSCPHPINLAFGTNTTLLQLITELEQITGLTSTLEHRPPRNGDVRHSQADGSLLLELFPRLAAVSLTDGLTATVAWFKEMK